MRTRKRKKERECERERRFTSFVTLNGVEWMGTGEKCV